jgi:hypothetical protein
MSMASGLAALIAGFSAMYFGFCVAVWVILVVAQWKIFEKAGRPGWAALVPIYSAIVLLEIVGKPGWWVLLLFIPLVNLVITVIAAIGLAASFGCRAEFAIGLVLLPIVFYPILGFGSQTYRRLGS